MLCKYTITFYNIWGLNISQECGGAIQREKHVDLPESIDFNYTTGVAELNATALAIFTDAPALPEKVSKATIYVGFVWMIISEIKARPYMLYL